MKTKHVSSLGHKRKIIYSCLLWWQAEKYWHALTGQGEKQGLEIRDDWLVEEQQTTSLGKDRSLGYFSVHEDGLGLHRHPQHIHQAARVTNCICVLPLSTANTLCPKHLVAIRRT
jgi:hypothetical protein